MIQDRGGKFRVKFLPCPECGKSTKEVVRYDPVQGTQIPGIGFVSLELLERSITYMHEDDTQCIKQFKCICDKTVVPMLCWDNDKHIVVCPCTNCHADYERVELPPISSSYEICTCYCSCDRCSGLNNGW